MLDGIDEINWKQYGLLKTSHGLSMPETIREFLTETDWEIWRVGDYWTVENLLCTLWDEDGLHPAAPLVFTFLLEILQIKGIVTRGDIIRCLFLEKEWHQYGGETAGQIRNIIHSNRTVFLTLLTDEDTYLTEQVGYFLAQHDIEGRESQVLIRGNP